MINGYKTRIIALCLIILVIILSSCSQNNAENQISDTEVKDKIINNIQLTEDGGLESASILSIGGKKSFILTVKHPFTRYNIFDLYNPVEREILDVDVISSFSIRLIEKDFTLASIDKNIDSNHPKIRIEYYEENSDNISCFGNYIYDVIEKTQEMVLNNLNPDITISYESVDDIDLIFSNGIGEIGTIFDYREKDTQPSVYNTYDELSCDYPELEKYMSLGDDYQFNSDEVESVTIGQKNALKSAEMYLSVSAFSYSGLVKQLKYEGYTAEEARYAVDNCGADWNEQAAKSAKAYLKVSSFSRQGLIDQLIYEGFLHSQAEYGADAVGY